MAPMAGPGETKINNTSYRECPLTKNGLSENHFSGSPSSLGSKKQRKYDILYSCPPPKARYRLIKLCISVK